MPFDARSTTRSTVGDRYQLEEVVGRGSSGTVWRAHDTRLDRRVAVKEIVFPPTPHWRASLVLVAWIVGSALLAWWVLRKRDVPQN